MSQNTAQITSKAIATYMREQILEYIDCGEVECTRLAGDACDRFDAYGPSPLCEVPEEYFELSFQVAQEYERLA